MHFVSDNAGPAHPRIMAALAAANEGHAMPYGACPWTARARDALREAFEAPQAHVHFVATGTVANALNLASLVEPWRRVFCSAMAHIEHDEWGALPFYAGAETALVPETDGRMSAAALEARILEEEEGRRGAVSVTQVTERGTVYPLDRLAALTEVAARHGLPVHMDGARFANAVAALGTTPAAMTEGVSAVSVGGTKGGCMGVEACLALDPDRGATLAPRRQRAGHTFSKHRYLAAQMAAFVEDGLWIDLATEANRKAARLAQGLAAHPDVTILHPVEANMIFARWPMGLHDKLRAAGAEYYLYPDRPDDPRPMARLVCDWSVDDDAIARFLDLLTAG